MTKNVPIRVPLPVAEPYLGELESEYVMNALNEEAISGFFGSYIGEFEEKFASFCEAKHAVSVTNGTVAVHLALVLSDIGPGDEVLVASYTNMASFFPVYYQGAKPVPIDIEPDTWNINPNLLEAKVNERTKAIIVVHIFGHPVDMDPVLSVAKKYGLKVIEDCAEAHGATYKNQKVGALGDIGCFSFYANKLLTTGEGGMVVMNDPELARRAKNVKSLAFGRENKFMHSEIGYNYRMSNIHAAIGCAQMEKIEFILKKKREIAYSYNTAFSDIDCLRLPVEKSYAKNVYWMYHLVLEENSPISRDVLMEQLSKANIETRPGFIPYNMQDIFVQSGETAVSECPVANYIGMNSLYIPCGPRITEAELGYVVEHVKSALSVDS